MKKSLYVILLVHVGDGFLARHGSSKKQPQISGMPRNPAPTWLSSTLQRNVLVQRARPGTSHQQQEQRLLEMEVKGSRETKGHRLGKDRQVRELEANLYFK